MRDVLECALVRAPLAASYAYQSIIWPFLFFNNSMRKPECGPERWYIHSAVREVCHTFAIGSFGIELFSHIKSGQLAKSPSLDTQSSQGAVDLGESLLPNPLEAVVCKSTSTMGTGDRRQALDLDCRRLQLTDHESCIQAAHTMSNDIDSLSSSFLLDFFTQSCSSLFNGSGWWDRCEDDFNVVGRQGFGDTSPVMNSRKDPSRQTKFVKAEEAVSKDDRILRSLVFRSYRSIVVLDGSAGARNTDILCIMVISGRDERLSKDFGVVKTPFKASFGIAAGHEGHTKIEGVLITEIQEADLNRPYSQASYNLHLLIVVTSKSMSITEE